MGCFDIKDMISFRRQKKEITTVKELFEHSFEAKRSKSNKINECHIRYVDLSPPLEEFTPVCFNNPVYWKKGRKEEYEG